MIIGYARVSSKEQNLDRQVQDLEKFGCEVIYKEKESAKSFDNRKIYQDMKKKLRHGDVLVIQDLSRLGRNKKEIKREWEELTRINENVTGEHNSMDIVVLNMPILDTRNYKNIEGAGRLIAELVFSILSWVVEEERNRIRTAQKEGIEIAKKQGKFKGRPLKYHNNAIGKDKIIYDDIVKRLKEKNSVMDIHLKTGVSRNTIYRIKKEV